MRGAGPAPAEATQRRESPGAGPLSLYIYNLHVVVEIIWQGRNSITACQRDGRQFLGQAYSPCGTLQAVSFRFLRTCGRHVLLVSFSLAELVWVPVRRLKGDNQKRK